ncbi:MAG: M36 family metallopeptidase [Flavobacteriales bacterium]|nr:M36 family metallopeptidase [Flavobacteriales bacterium]
MIPSLHIKALALPVLSCCVALLGPTAARAQADARSEVGRLAAGHFAASATPMQFIVNDAYTDTDLGITHGYVQQVYGGVPVHNAIAVVALRNGQLAHIAEDFVRDIASKANASTPSISAAQAVVSALQHLKRPIPDDLVQMGSNAQNGHLRFSLPEVSARPVEVGKVYLPVGDEVRLAWNVSIEMKDVAHWWNIRVDAHSGQFIDRDDYTASCSLHPATYRDRTRKEGRAQGLHPHPAPLPMPVATSSYRVFPLPVEAPTFGTRSLMEDPADPIASPFGWHDTNGADGAEYTIARGNNTHAYEDADNDNLPGYSPDGGGALAFDFALLPDVEPMDNRDAALTNLFYQTNAIHDVLYAHGFNEAAGNFQQNNYGRGGSGGDHVWAEGFDGSGTNNANFSTPPDGSEPRMQMYLWNSEPVGCSTLGIVSDGFTGTMEVGTAEFTAVGTVTAPLILADDEVGTGSDACTDILNNVAGKIVLIDRGGCNFISKAQRAEAAGAVGLIIANNVAGGPTGMAGSPQVGIPVLSVSLADGGLLRSELLLGTVEASLVTCARDTFDSNFDNGIIAHEYGHGLSNRLTGGPSQSSCLANEEQGGEGWSDWLALMLTITPADQGADARGMGSYVANDPNEGGGIRTFPYSTDMAVNPLTYGDLDPVMGVHARGEIWCAAIWDMSWLLMDAHGFNSSPADVAAGNNIAIRLVLEGLKLQPCSPGYLDARDAILAADELLFDKAHRPLIWEAFARRGMGCSAAQGSANAVGDETEAFDMPTLFYRDQDEDGHGHLWSTELACTQPIGFVTNSVDCDDTDPSVGPDCLQWIGTLSEDWDAPGNWSNGTVPTSSDDVRISAVPSNQPVIGGALAECLGLEVQSGALLTIAPGHALTANGDLTSAGTVHVMADELGIGSLITLGSVTGAGTFQADQYLTGAGGATPSGVFYYVSSAVAGANAASYGLASGNRLWSASESTQTYPQMTDGATVLNAGQGYVVRMGGSGSRELSGTAFNTGNVTLNGLTRTGAGANAGYNLVGNPYPSSVSWDAAIKGNLEDDIWFRTHTDALLMNFDVYNAVSGIGTDNNRFNQDVTGIVPPGQAFWVRVLDGETSGSLGFDNAMRSHGMQSALYRLAAEEGTVRMRITGATGSDVTIVHFTTEAENGYDAFDSRKMFGAATLPQLHTTAANEAMAINGLFSTATNPIVDLAVRIPATGDYILTAHSITLNEEVWLEDRLLNAFEHLNLNPVYAFTADAGNMDDRFALHFGAVAVGVEENTSISHVFASDGVVNIIVGNDLASGTIAILDMAGRMVRTASISGNRTVMATDLATGIYLVRIETVNGSETHRILLR